MSALFAKLFRPYLSLVRRGFWMDMSKTRLSSAVVRRCSNFGSRKSVLALYIAVDFGTRTVLISHIENADGLLVPCKSFLVRLFRSPGMFRGLAILPNPKSFCPTNAALRCSCPRRNCCGIDQSRFGIPTSSELVWCCNEWHATIFFSLIVVQECFFRGIYFWEVELIVTS